MASCGFKSEEADLIVHNAQIHTFNPAKEVVQAMAIKDGKILELGAERQILNKYRAADTYDAGQQVIYPGFIDAHCHFLGYGLFLDEVDLIGTTSWDDVLQRLQEHVAKNELLEGQWLEGRGWDQNDWEEQSFPTSAALDSLFPDRPVLLSRVDGHAAVVNSKAMELSGVNPDQELVGGEFIKENGVFTGVLIDNAIDAVSDAIPEPDNARLIKALKHAEENCFAVGLTTVDDAGLDVDHILLIDSLQKAGELKMRMYVMVSDKQENVDYYMENGPYKSDRLNVRSFKFYADGALGSRGACLLKSYTDKETHKGFLLDSIAHFEERALQMKLGGFQMNTHCIGDSANRVMLNLYGEMLEGTNDLRWRIEHAQVVHKMDVPLFGAYSVLPSIQPTHATSDMYWAEIRLGRNRVRRAYAYRELLGQNGMVCLGTDFPVEGINPLNTFYAAVVRKDTKGYPEGGFQIENALTREEALNGMTLWAAVSNFEEEEKGTLESGKLADFIVLDRDLLTVPENEILTTQVQRTYVNGELVWQR